MLVATSLAAFTATLDNTVVAVALRDVQADLGAGVDELQADLEAGAAAGLLPPHDTRLLAAAMIGAGLEIGVRLLEQDPVDIDGAVLFYTTAFLGSIEALGRAGSSSA